MCIKKLNLFLLWLFTPKRYILYICSFYNNTACNLCINKFWKLLVTPARLQNKSRRIKNTSSASILDANGNYSNLLKSICKNSWNHIVELYSGQFLSFGTSVQPQWGRPWPRNATTAIVKVPNWCKFAVLRRLPEDQTGWGQLRLDLLRLPQMKP